MEFNEEFVEEQLEKIKDLIQKSSLNDALELNIRIYEEALANDHSRLIANCLMYFGEIENKRGLPQKAMSFYKKATVIARKHKHYRCLVKTLNNRGNIYIVNGKTYSAIEKYSEALMIIETHKQVLDYKSKLLNNLGLLYLEVKDYPLAKKYLFECISIAKEPGDELILTTAYSNLTDVYIAKKNFLKAKYYNNLSEQISLKINDQIGRAIAIGNDAIILAQEKQDWSVSKQLFQMAINIMEEIDDEKDKEELLVKYGIQAFESGDLELSEEILTKLVKCAREKTYYSIESKSLETLQKIYEKQGDYQKAYLASKRQLQLKEMTYSQWKQQSIKKADRTFGETHEFSFLNDLQKSIRTLKQLSELGQKITACIHIDEIYDILLSGVLEIFQCDAFGVGIKKKDNITIDYKFFDERGITELDISVLDKKYLMANCIHIGEEIIIYDTKDHEYNEHHLSEHLIQIVKESDNETIIFCPIKFNNESIGGVTIQTRKKGQLTYVDLETLRVLTSYLGIAYSNLNRASELVIANKKLEQASMLDGLTGTFNRYALGQYIGKEFIGMLERKLPTTALMIDIDFFKQYNDNYGHVKGDQCLKKVCIALRNSLSDYAYRLFRYGGDEFFVVIEGCDYKEAVRLLKKVFEELKAMNIEHLYSKIENRVTLTIGAAIIDRMIMDYTSVFTLADEALYVAKDSGRNKYSINRISESALYQQNKLKKV